MRKINESKGITLVALVITIIILIILAGITISLVLGDNGLIGKSKQGANDYKEAASNEQEMLGKINDIIDGAGIGTGTGGVNTQGGPTTYPEYTVGQIVKLGGESFYVIEDSDESSNTLKVLAALNVKTTFEEGRYKQMTTANTLRFDGGSNDYSASEIKKHVDKYKIAVERRWGKTIQEARLMTKEEVMALGGDKAGGTTAGCVDQSAFINATNYWLESPSDAANAAYYEPETYTAGPSGFSRVRVKTTTSHGMRPVFVIAKSDVISTDGTRDFTTNFYEIGQKVTLGEEDFYVIEDSEPEETTVKLLAGLNVKTTSGDGQYTQKSDANNLRFSAGSNDYTTSEIKNQVNAYKTAVEGRWGKTIQEARLMTKNEVLALGGNNISGGTTSCTGTVAFINNSKFWLGTANDASNAAYYSPATYYAGEGYFSTYTSSYANLCGMRPVFVVLKSDL